jgi:branched-chain amino acid transport system ATP-binding protein
MTLTADNGSAPPLLSAEHLVAGYFDDIHILNDLSVRVWPGKISCVIGPNGTGKSTLLKTISGFLTPIEGRVVYGEQEITGVAPFDMLALGIAYLPQQPSIFPFLSVEVNLRLGLWRQRLGRGELQEKLAEAYERFPILREKRRQPAGELSGGQQRQLEFARSLLTGPELYLIDEPSAGVDPKTSKEIYRIVVRLAHEDGKGVLLVDQDIRNALKIADHVFVVRAGKLFAQGPREEFGNDTEALVARWLYESGEV